MTLSSTLWPAFAARELPDCWDGQRQGEVLDILAVVRLTSKGYGQRMRIVDALSVVIALALTGGCRGPKAEPPQTPAVVQSLPSAARAVPSTPAEGEEVTLVNAATGQEQEIVVDDDWLLLDDDDCPSVSLPRSLLEGRRRVSYECEDGNILLDGRLVGVEIAPGDPIDLEEHRGQICCFVVKGSGGEVGPPIFDAIRTMGADQVSLTVEATEVAPTTLAELSRLPNVRALNLMDPDLTDAGLAHLSGLPNLRGLHLGGTQVTDAGLAHLSGLANLRVLDLSLIRVTDAGLAHLSGLANLRELTLRDTKVTDAGLARLSRLPKLRLLNLRSTQVTDAGLAHLSRLANLRELTLWDTKVTDAGLAHLSRLPNLRDAPTSVGPR